MKSISIYILLANLVFALASCADNNILDYSVDKPVNMAQYEYLNNYDALKTYVDRNTHPNFKLGSGITVSDFLKKELVYSLACANYDELTAGNAMKYSSVVKDNGTMDFSQVAKFVDAAKAAGLTIYGHTLCWHSQQNNKYLNGIIADKALSGSGTAITKNYVVQSDFEDGAALMGWGNGSTRNVVNGKGYNGTKGLEIVNPKAADPWSAQAGYDFANALTEGETYSLNLKIKGSTSGSIGAGFQKPDGYAGRGDFSSIDITTDWKEITVQTKVTGDGATRLLFNLGKFVGTIWMDDIALYSEKKGNSIPLTPEEKADTLSWAMEQWVKGMMKACNGNVKAWDAVNEPLSGTDKNGDGLYDLQSVKNTSSDDAKNNFYWQDYLGDDYVRLPIKFARKYGPQDMKLFINDYNLESDWDDNKKLKSLIKWIERWESDGVTKIDGIGTQMHVSYYMNSTTQKSKEDHIVKMFNLLKESGKLVKISELDMGIIGEDGNSIKTINLTFEQKILMSDFYKFIIEKYFEIIPVAQQYGITHWSPTDSPEDNSSWRKGEPIGLWDLNYNRKPVYGGFANGLAGKVLFIPSK